MYHLVKLNGIIFNITNMFLMPTERGNGYKLIVGNKEILINSEHALLLEEYIKKAKLDPNTDITYNDLTPDYQYSFVRNRDTDLPESETYEQRMKKAKEEFNTVIENSPFKQVERSPKPSDIAQYIKDQKDAEEAEYWKNKRNSNKQTGESDMTGENKVTDNTLTHDGHTFKATTYEEQRMLSSLKSAKENGMPSNNI